MTREIPLSRGMVALVDDEDYARVMAAGPWCAAPQQDRWYAKSRHVYMHSIVLETRQVIDHKDRDGLNNQRANLRPTDQSHNSANSKLRKDNATGFKGVGFEPRTGRYRSRIRVQRVQRSLGNFLTPEEAARAYDTAAVAAWGEFARINFPQEGAA